MCTSILDHGDAFFDDYDEYEREGVESLSQPHGSKLDSPARKLSRGERSKETRTSVERAKYVVSNLNMNPQSPIYRSLTDKLEHALVSFVATDPSALAVLRNMPSDITNHFKHGAVYLSDSFLPDTDSEIWKKLVGPSGPYTFIPSSQIPLEGGGYPVHPKPSTGSGTDTTVQGGLNALADALKHKYQSDASGTCGKTDRNFILNREIFGNSVESKESLPPKMIPISMEKTLNEILKEECTNDQDLRQYLKKPQRPNFQLSFRVKLIDSSTFVELNSHKQCKDLVLEKSFATPLCIECFEREVYVPVNDDELGI